MSSNSIRVSNPNYVVQIYNSRNVILELLRSKHNYNIDEYKGFSTNEIDAMINTNQLDMLLTHVGDGSQPAPYKTYVKYCIKSSFSGPGLLPIIEDLFIDTNTLQKEDTLIVIFDGEPNDSFKSHLVYKYMHDGIFVVAHNIKRLQFNILEHMLMPNNIHILDAKYTAELIQNYHLKSTKELPEISRFDPMALAICLRPDQVCGFERKSPTSLVSKYYRVCV